MAVTTAFEQLRAATHSLQPCSPIRELIGPDDVARAYEIQKLLTNDRLASGARVVGRKVGLTSMAVQRQLGVDQPDFGVLFADMERGDSVEIGLDELIQPKVEAEIALVLADDLTDGTVGVADAAAAVEYAVAAIEIVDSRIANWDIAFTDTVADNASSALYVLGTQRRTLDFYQPIDARMRMRVDDALVSEGTGAACLGDPLKALAWLARTAYAFDDPLRAGQVILCGALGPMVPIGGPCQVRADITGLGSVTTVFV